MPRTFTATELRGLILDLYNEYLLLPGKIGRNFEDYSICISCKHITAENGICKCGKTVGKRSKRKTKKKSVGIPKAVR